jgi:choline-sulfatase
MQEDPGEWHNLADEPVVHDIVAGLNDQIRNFWKPDQYDERLASTPKARREKHFYEFSNQFMLGNGIVSNARP